MGYTFAPPNAARSTKRSMTPMKIFLDTADVAEIREYAASGLVDGVTTNPSLAAKTGKDYVESLKEICAIVPGAVSAEVLATDFDGMMKEGKAVCQDRQEHHRQGAADLGRAEGLRARCPTTAPWSMSRCASRRCRR